MIRIIAALAAVGLISLAVITWSTQGNVRPRDAATVAKAEAAAVGGATISPLEIMTKRGKKLPVEDHWDAF